MPGRITVLIVCRRWGYESFLHQLQENLLYDQNSAAQANSQIENVRFALDFEFWDYSDV